LGGGASARGSFDCVHLRRRDFVVDHAAEEVGVAEYARLAMARLAALRQQAKGEVRQQGRGWVFLGLTQLVVVVVGGGGGA